MELLARVEGAEGGAGHDGGRGGGRRRGWRWEKAVRTWGKCWERAKEKRVGLGRWEERVRESERALA